MKVGGTRQFRPKLRHLCTARMPTMGLGARGEIRYHRNQRIGEAATDHGDVDGGGDDEHDQGHLGPKAAAGGGAVGVGPLVDVEQLVRLRQHAHQHPHEAHERRQRAHRPQHQAVDEQHRRPGIRLHRARIHGPARLPSSQSVRLGET
jgi:hypothetical protein